MGGKSRRKGCRGELEAAAELRRLFGVEGAWSRDWAPAERDCFGAWRRRKSIRAVEVTT